MAQPRFMLMRVCRLERPARRTVQRDRSARVGRELDAGCNFGWRLLSSNNRELGRGSVLYGSEQECRVALARGQAEFLDSSPLITVGADGQWSWRYAIGGNPFAAAARGYQRQRECRHSLALFVLALAKAEFTDPSPCGSGAACPTSPRPDVPASMRRQVANSVTGSGKVIDSRTVGFAASTPVKAS